MEKFPAGKHKFTTVESLLLGLRRIPAMFEQGEANPAYLDILRKYLKEKGQTPDKPLAFLCNPPYRSDDDQAAAAATSLVGR